MGVVKGSCPLSGRQVVEEYFMENRTRVLDLAAFLDRLGRARDEGGLGDHRVRALREALQVLASPATDKVDRVQALLSDPRLEPLSALDRQSATGAYDTSLEDA